MLRFRDSLGFLCVVAGLSAPALSAQTPLSSPAAPIVPLPVAARDAQPTVTGQPAESTTREESKPASGAESKAESPKAAVPKTEVPKEKKWYEKFSIRGYTQFRTSETV